MSDNRPARYVDDDGNVIYRASSLQMCDRIFVALSQDYEPMAKPEWFQEVLDEGTAMEQTIREMFEQDYASLHAFTVVNDQREVSMEILDGVYIRGHIDGLTDDGNVKTDLWEGKKIRPSGWQRFQRVGVEYVHHYPMQVAFYMHALREEFGTDDFGCYFTGGLYNPDKQIIEDIYTHHLTEPPVPLKAIKLRIAKLEGLINDDVSVMDVKCPVPPTYPCPMYYLHDDDADEPPHRAGDDVIAPLIEEWQRFKDAEAKAKAIYNADKKETKETLKRVREGIIAWAETNGIEDGEAFTLAVGDKTYEIKAGSTFRRGYVVEDNTYQSVKIKEAKATGKKGLK